MRPCADYRTYVLIFLESELLPLADRRRAVGQDRLLHRHALHVAQHALNLVVGIACAAYDLLDAVAGLLGESEAVQQRTGAEHQQEADEIVPELFHLCLLSADALDEAGKVILALELDLDLVLPAHFFNLHGSLKCQFKLPSCAFE